MSHTECKYVIIKQIYNNNKLIIETTYIVDTFSITQKRITVLNNNSVEYRKQTNTCRLHWALEQDFVIGTDIRTKPTISPCVDIMGIKNEVTVFFFI